MIVAKTDLKVVKSTNESLEIEITTNFKTKADLYSTSILIGLPNNDIPKLQIISTEEIGLLNNIKPIETKIFKWSKIQLLRNLNTIVLKVNPHTDNKSFLKKLRFILFFNKKKNLQYKIADKNESKMLSSRIINWNNAKNWLVKKNNKRINTSNFPSGKWLSFNLTKDGMKKIRVSELFDKIDNLNSYDPRSLMLYMPQYLGRSKPNFSNTEILDNLLEIPIIFDGVLEDSFESNENLIFYGQGTSGFDINEGIVQWNQNLYFNSNKCWILLPDDNSLRGKRISEAEIPLEIQIPFDYGLSYYHHEIDIVNLEQSGLNWLGSPLPPGNTVILPINTPNAKENVDATIELKLKGHSINESINTNHNISLNLNNPTENQIAQSSWNGNGFRTITGTIPGQIFNQSTNSFFINNNSNNNTSSPYIDYLKIKYGRKLIIDTDEFEFYSPVTGMTARFDFSEQITADHIVLDISNPENPQKVPIIDYQKIEVTLNDNKPSRFIISKKSTITEINEIEIEIDVIFNELRNENILANYIIIGPKSFYQAAQNILNIRSPSIYASLESIYNEFSGGNKDPIAIRTFLQWTQEYWQSPKPIHVLLLGDAGYDYRNITGQSNIIVPTIQVQSYISYPSDDRFSTIYGNLPELSTGRFPARNTNEVEIFSEKIQFIENENNFGTWKQKITLIADDAARPEPNHGGVATGKSHTLNSETIAQIIPSIIDVQKIYMLEFPEQSDASAYGVIKPLATEAVLSSLSQGVGIINYIGHGSSYQLAQEKLLYLNRGDLDRINTNGKMPLWIVGTCSFGHFDDPNSESFAEELIRKQMDAASSVISTCRPITVTGNERYTQDLFENIFTNNEITNLEIGLILQSIKNGSSESEYFHLFGDPGMKLPISLNSINNIEIDPDTLSALGNAYVTVNTSLFDNLGNGVLILKDSDKSVTREYNIASTTESISYILPGPTLFRGNFSFDDFPTTAQLRVPLDISYSNNPGRILIYVFNDEIDAIGSLDQIYINGSVNSFDEIGPIIEFKTETGRILRSGDHLNNDENIIIVLSDPMGINLTKELGHSIILNNLSEGSSIDLTDYFFYDNNSITSGEIILNDINELNIKLNVNAWDNANNQSEKDIQLQRLENKKLTLFNVFNFPNPFSISTQFTFELSSAANICIYIYTLGGKKIKKIDCELLPNGFHSIEWNGMNQYNSEIANGVYIYKIIANNDKEKIDYIGRCAKLK